MCENAKYLFNVWRALLYNVVILLKSLLNYA